MKAPRPPGSKIDAKRVNRWVQEFAGYRTNVNEGRIDRWLDQFEGDRDVAARILDVVDFMSQETIAAAFRAALARLQGWSIAASKRRGKWRFVPFSISAGESGDSMLHAFRIANGLSGKKFDDLFVAKRDLPSERLSAEDTVVFVDDFAGTGDQAVRAWKETLSELLPGRPSSYLVLVAASGVARRRISDETSLTVVPHHVLGESDNIFGKECRHFSVREKEILSKYCMLADSKRPKGHGDCGFVIVFAHNCPNNSIPILHAFHEEWEGLFRRHD